MDYVISDTHFGHEAIIDYEDRPFDGITEMDNSIVSNINSIVTKSDRLFWLGDISFLNKAETKHIMSLIKCKSNHLILGNHDKGHTKTWWKDVGFNYVYDFPIVYKGFLMLSHEPMYVNSHMPYANLHGHTHGNSMTSAQSINCCVEVTDYKPVSIQSIIERF